MAAPDIAEALERVSLVLARRPEAGVQYDAPATARWDGGTRMLTRHPGGAQVATDMPQELGGTGGEVTPGWLFRAGLASCTATCIVMAAAREGIVLSMLELRVGSRSDTRGLLGMSDSAGRAVPAASQDVRLHVCIAANGVAPERLRALVERSHQASPVACALHDGTAVALQIEVGDAGAQG